jgi:hypothetical protein
MATKNKPEAGLPVRTPWLSHAALALNLKTAVARWHQLAERAASDEASIEQLAGFLPVLTAPEPPRFTFAVYSIKDGAGDAHLLCSCLRRADAERLLDACQASAKGDETLFLVNWPKRQVLRLSRCPI